MYNNDLNRINTIVLLGQGTSYGTWITINLKDSIDNYRLLNISVSDNNGSTMVTQLTCSAHFKMHNINRVYFLISNNNIECLCGGGTSTTMMYYIKGSVSGYTIDLWGII